MTTNKIYKIFILLVLSTIASSQELVEKSSSNSVHGAINCNGKVAVCVGPLMYKNCVSDTKGIMYANGTAKRCPNSSRCVNDGVEICVPLKTSTDAPVTEAIIITTPSVAQQDPSTEGPLNPIVSSPSTPLLQQNQGTNIPGEATNSIVETVVTPEAIIIVPNDTSNSISATVFPDALQENPKSATLESELSLKTSYATEETTFVTEETNFFTEETTFETYQPSSLLENSTTFANFDNSVNVNNTVKPTNLPENSAADSLKTTIIPYDVNSVVENSVTDANLKEPVNVTNTVNPIILPESLTSANQEMTTNIPFNDAFAETTETYYYTDVDELHRPADLSFITINPPPVSLGQSETEIPNNLVDSTSHTITTYSEATTFTIDPLYLSNGSSDVLVTNTAPQESSASASTDFLPTIDLSSDKIYITTLHPDLISIPDANSLAIDPVSTFDKITSDVSASGPNFTVKPTASVNPTNKSVNSTSVPNYSNTEISSSATVDLTEPVNLNAPATSNTSTNFDSTFSPQPEESPTFIPNSEYDQFIQINQSLLDQPIEPAYTEAINTSSIVVSTGTIIPVYASVSFDSNTPEIFTDDHATTSLVVVGSTDSLNDLNTNLVPHVTIAAVNSSSTDQDIIEDALSVTSAAVDTNIPFYSPTGSTNVNDIVVEYTSNNINASNPNVVVTSNTFPESDTNVNPNTLINSNNVINQNNVIEQNEQNTEGSNKPVNLNTESNQNNLNINATDLALTNAGTDPTIVFGPKAETDQNAQDNYNITENPNATPHSSTINEPNTIDAVYTAGKPNTLTNQNFIDNQETPVDPSSGTNANVSSYSSLVDKADPMNQSSVVNTNTNALVYANVPHFPNTSSRKLNNDPNVINYTNTFKSDEVSATNVSQKQNGAVNAIVLSDQNILVDSNEPSKLHVSEVLSNLNTEVNPNDSEDSNIMFTLNEQVDTSSLSTLKSLLGLDAQSNPNGKVDPSNNLDGSKIETNRNSLDKTTAPTRPDVQHSPSMSPSSTTNNATKYTFPNSAISYETDKPNLSFDTNAPDNLIISNAPEHSNLSNLVGHNSAVIIPITLKYSNASSNLEDVSGSNKSNTSNNLDDRFPLENSVAAYNPNLQTNLHPSVNHHNSVKPNLIVDQNVLSDSTVDSNFGDHSDPLDSLKFSVDTSDQSAFVYLDVTNSANSTADPITSTEASRAVNITASKIFDSLNNINASAEPGYQSSSVTNSITDNINVVKPGTTVDQTNADNVNNTSVLNYATNSGTTKYPNVFTNLNSSDILITSVDPTDRLISNAHIDINSHAATEKHSSVNLNTPHNRLNISSLVGGQNAETNPSTTRSPHISIETGATFEAIAETAPSSTSNSFEKTNRKTDQTGKNLLTDHIVTDNKKITVNSNIPTYSDSLAYANSASSVHLSTTDTRNVPLSLYDTTYSTKSPTHNFTTNAITSHDPTFDVNTKAFVNLLESNDTLSAISTSVTHTTASTDASISVGPYTSTYINSKIQNTLHDPIKTANQNRTVDYNAADNEYAQADSNLFKKPNTVSVHETGAIENNIADVNSFVNLYASDKFKPNISTDQSAISNAVANLNNKAYLGLYPSADKDSKDESNASSGAEASINSITSSYFNTAVGTNPEIHKKETTNIKKEQVQSNTSTDPATIHLLRSTADILINRNNQINGDVLVNANVAIRPVDQVNENKAIDYSDTANRNFPDNLSYADQHTSTDRDTRVDLNNVVTLAVNPNNLVISKTPDNINANAASNNSIADPNTVTFKNVLDNSRISLNVKENPNSIVVSSGSVNKSKYINQNELTDFNTNTYTSVSEDSYASNKHNAADSSSKDLSPTESNNINYSGEPNSSAQSSLENVSNVSINLNTTVKHIITVSSDTPTDLKSTENSQKSNATDPNKSEEATTTDIESTESKDPLNTILNEDSSAEDMSQEKNNKKKRDQEKRMKDEEKKKKEEEKKKKAEEKKKKSEDKKEKRKEKENRKKEVEKERKEGEKKKKEDEKKKKEEDKKKKVDRENEKKEGEENKHKKQEERKKKKEEDQNKNESNEKAEERESKKQKEEQKKLIKKIIELIDNDECEADDIYPDVKDCRRYYRCIEKSDNTKIKHLHCNDDKRFDFKEKKCVNKRRARCLLKDE